MYGNEWIISSCTNFVVCISQADTVKSVSDNYSDNISANGPIKREITTHSVRRTDICIRSNVRNWRLKNIIVFQSHARMLTRNKYSVQLIHKYILIFFFREMDGYGHLYTIPISLRRRVLYTRFRKIFLFKLSVTIKITCFVERSRTINISF